MKNIVTMGWLAEKISDADMVIVDCRFIMGQSDAGRIAYEQDHIPGAVYAHLEQDLSGPVREHGGRHPLPDMGPFSQWLGQLGIDKDTTVVAYDDQGGAMASRFWWMLCFLGHEHVYILETGFTQWKAAGYPVSAERHEPSAKHFIPSVKTRMLISVHDVRDKLGQPGIVLLDSREQPRYLGLQEPIDPVAGHIPGAINSFWKISLNANGLWKDAEEHATRFEYLNKEDEIIVYCGSGVTACPNVLALEEAGFPNVKLYLGSWSDWISYEGNPVATGEE
ncbi:MAG: sulfurtransferase [Paenibacillaceae bacterium]